MVRTLTVEDMSMSFSSSVSDEYLYVLRDELIDVIVDDEQTYQKDLNHFLDTYSQVFTSHVHFQGTSALTLFMASIQRLLNLHVKFLDALRSALGDHGSICNIISVTMGQELLPLYREYLDQLESVSDAVIDGFSTHPDLYRFFLTARDADKECRSYVQLLLTPRQRLVTLKGQLKRLLSQSRVQDAQRWEDTLLRVEKLTIIDVTIVETLPTVCRAKSLNIFKRVLKPGAKCYLKVLRKIWEEDNSYLDALDNFLTTYGSVLKRGLIEKDLIQEYLILVERIIEIHCDFKNNLQDLLETMDRRMADVFQATFNTTTVKIYAEHFVKVSEVSLAIMRNFNTQPELYEKLLLARNQDDDLSSYSSLMSKPKSRLLTLEEDLGQLVKMSVEGNDPDQTHTVRAFINVRKMIKSSHPPLQETLASPSKDLVKRSKGVKKLAKRKLNQSVIEVQASVVKKHRFRQSLGHDLNRVRDDKKSKLNLSR